MLWQAGWTAGDAAAAEGLWSLIVTPRPPQRSALAGAGGAVRQRGAAADAPTTGTAGVAAVATCGNGLEHDGRDVVGAAYAVGAAVDALGQGAARAASANGHGSSGNGLSDAAQASWAPASGIAPAVTAACEHARPAEPTSSSTAALGSLERRDMAQPATGSTLDPAGGPPVLLVANKADLLPERGATAEQPWPRLPGERAPAAMLRTSAATGAGLDALRDALLRAAGLAQVAPGALPCIAWLFCMTGGDRLDVLSAAMLQAAGLQERRAPFLPCFATFLWRSRRLRVQYAPHASRITSFPCARAAVARLRSGAECWTLLTCHVC